jgi:hypothetical protein
MRCVIGCVSKLYRHCRDHTRYHRAHRAQRRAVSNSARKARDRSEAQRRRPCCLQCHGGEASEGCDIPRWRRRRTCEKGRRSRAQLTYTSGLFTTSVRLAHQARETIKNQPLLVAAEHELAASLRATLRFGWLGEDVRDL